MNPDIENTAKRQINKLYGIASNLSQPTSRFSLS